MNLGQLGDDWFDEWQKNLADVLDTLIQVFSPQFVKHPGSDRYLDAMSRLGARISMLALENPGLFAVTDE